MTDGPAHARRTRALGGALDAVDPRRVRALAVEETGRAAGWSDLQFGVPVRVVARLLGVTGPECDGVPAAVARFVRAIPPSAGPQDAAVASGAADELLALLDGAGGTVGAALREAAGTDAEERAAATANLLGLLSQTYEATAGLVGGSILATAGRTRPADAAAFVAEVARHDAPIQSTRRVTTADGRIQGRPVPAGATVLLLLAAANRDPAANPDPHAFRPDRAAPRMFTFGLAAHRCPGRVPAVAIAAGVLDALPGGAPQRPHGFRPSANARIPLLEEATT